MIIKKILTLLLVMSALQCIAQGFEGYYQHPDIYQNTIVFIAEGDVWKVPLTGGLAHRITTHAEEESHPVISPDGKSIAYSASYEGPREVYTIPINGGITRRLTYSEHSEVVNWAADGNIIYRTSEFSKLPNNQLVKIDHTSNKRAIVPLHQANDGTQNISGTWYFVPLPDFNENVKRYTGGTARQIWKFEGNNEAVKLTTDHLGESFNPMWHDGRVFFITDRDGIQNIWSMDETGGALKQHTKHEEFDVRSANLDNGLIVYQHGANLWILDITSGEYKKIDIQLTSDLSSLQETWIEDPTKYITSVNPSPTGDGVVVTSRGRVFVVPTEIGLTLSFAEPNGSVVRHRDAVFSHDGQNIIALSDQNGELEFVQFATDRSGNTTPITNDGQMLRYQGVPSSDGKWIAYDDAEKNLFVLNVSTGKSNKVSSVNEWIKDFSWSPDNQWLAFTQGASNQLYQIKIYNVNDGSVFDLTNDRSNNFSAKWSPDGKYIYLLSDRGFNTLSGKPRYARLGGVNWDKSEGVYLVPLQAGTMSPFREWDEINGDASNDVQSGSKSTVNIDKDGIQSRIMQVPVPSGNYSHLEVNDRAIYLLAQASGLSAPSHLKAVQITRGDAALNEIASDIHSFEMSQNREKLLIKKGQSYYMVHAGTGAVSLTSPIDLSGCKFSYFPQEEWKQLYKDAWRMERDYFYDKNMHGVDWDAMYEKYLPLVDRVTTRNELNDVLGRLVGELSVLHAGANGGDLPDDHKYIGVASLGATTSRDKESGGFRIDYIFTSDPDFPRGRSPLDDPYLDVRVGDVITKVNGINALIAVNLGELLRNQAGKQVRLTLKRGSVIRDIIVKPTGSTYWTRYGDWEYHNRLTVEKESDGQIGYLHMSAMSEWDIGQFYRGFFPVANRQGLIIDMRNNAGGWIDPIILEKLVRQIWMYRVDRTGEPHGELDYAFQGHLVVLVNERTGSDGEVFSEGIRHLGLGTTIGVRTWGGFIALNSRNTLTDNGIMTAPMHGGYTTDGTWFPDNHGHVPDIEVENLPYETFNGKDAQLEAAINYLLNKIKEDPREVSPVPVYPDKSFENNRKD